MIEHVTVDEEPREFVAVPVEVVERAYRKALSVYSEDDGFEDSPGETWAEFEALADWLPGSPEHVEPGTLGDVRRLVVAFETLQMMVDELVELADRMRPLANGSPLRDANWGS